MIMLLFFLFYLLYLYHQIKLIDFELPEHYTADLIYEIAKMIGINLRDADVVAYANSEVTSRKQAETF